MDAFFAAIEQRERPELRGRPVVVGGLSARGVVSTASYEARRFGIHSAMPMLEARSRCPHATFLPGRMQLYRRESERVFQIFRRFSPVVEGLSLDEAFLDLAGCERLLGPVEEIARLLRHDVYATTGLCVSVGIAPVKLVAKIASDHAKPDGVRIVREHEIAAFLGPLSVRRIWGLGPGACERLESVGIRTVGELRQRSEAELRTHIGARAARALELARGRDPRRVDAERLRKSYGEECTFTADRCVDDGLRAVVTAQARAVARRLRRDGKRARLLTLKLKLAERVARGRYRMLTRSRTFVRATDDGLTLAEAALALLVRANPSAPVRLVGVSAQRLEEATAGSRELFPEPESARRDQLNRTVDEIRSRFGEGSLRSGAEPAECPSAGADADRRARGKRT